MSINLLAGRESSDARVNKMSSNPRKRMRAAKAAEYLEVSRSTLAKWRMRGIGPAPHYCGPRIVYYCQHEIDAWLEECDRRQKAAQKTAGKQKAPV